MLYSSEKMIDIFDVISGEETQDERLDYLRQHNVAAYRAKTYKAGELLESEVFPIWKNRGQWLRAKRKKQTRAAQIIINARNTKKNIVRITNANFTFLDLWVTYTYAEGELPKDFKQAYRDIQNCIARLKYRRERKKLPKLKYIYVTEWHEDGRCHHHLILSGGMSRDEVEEVWTKGRKQARRLQPDDFGLTGLACYLSKGSSGEKRWGHSKNLKYPVPTVSERKLSKRKIERIALIETEAKEVFERAYPGYQFLDVEIRYSAVVSGAYVYARMRKKNDKTRSSKRE